MSSFSERGPTSCGLAQQAEAVGNEGGLARPELLVPVDYWFEPAWGPIYLEIKNDNGRLTKHQKTMLALLDQAGGHTATVRSIDDTRAYPQQRIELRA